MPAPPIRIAIVGGGISGLCLASVLAKYDTDGKLSISVYEAAASFGEVGAGVAIWGRSFQITGDLGLQEELEAIEMKRPSNDAISFRFRRSDQGAVGHEFARKPFGNTATYHRAQFLGVFAKHVQKAPNIQTHFDKRLLSVSRDAGGELKLHFRDGTTVECDVVVGADGIRSAVRVAMLDFAAADLGDDSLRLAGPASYSGDCIYRALIPMAQLREIHAQLGGTGPMACDAGYPVVFCGFGKRVVVFTIQNGAVANIVVTIVDPSKAGTTFPDDLWVSNINLEPGVLEKEFETWEPELRALVQGLRSTAALRWAIHVVPDLKFFSHGQVAVIGDAAHAMVPYHGSGGNQAMEDAYVLGRMLAHPSTTRENAHLAMQAYDAVRRERAQAVLRLSREMGLLQSLRSDVGGDEEAIAARLTSPANDWVEEGEIEADVRRAEEHFAALIAAKA